MSEVEGGAAATAPEAVESTEVETEAEAAEGAEAAPPAKEAPKAAESRRKKFQLKVDGHDLEEEIDLDNEEEIKKHLQLSKVSQKRMQEVAEYKKQVAQFFDLLKNDPIRVLSDPKLSLNLKDIANRVLNEEVEDLKKTPEQRERDKAVKELEALRKQLEEEKKGKEAAEFKRLQEQAAVQLDSDISSALESEGLPKNSERAVRYMAEALMFGLKNNMDLTAKEVAPYIKKQMLAEYRDIVSGLPEDQLEEFIGKDTISKVRKRSIAKMKAPVDTAQAIKASGAEPKGKATESEKIPFKKLFTSF